MDFPFALNADLMDSQYQLWKSDPKQVSQEWRHFFLGFDLAASPEFGSAGPFDKTQLSRQFGVDELIYRYRDLGHLLACLDPLTTCPMDHPLLSLSAFNLSHEDLDREFQTHHFTGSTPMPLREILGVLRETYCRSIGVEYMHMQDPGERRWLQQRMEPTRNRPALDEESKLRILNKLCQATLFEQFLHTKYLGQKRFSIEGAEVITAMLDGLAQHAADELGVGEMILGMAHRGRLNIQVNVLNKLYEAVFCEFEDHYDPASLVGSGDVKYHKGTMSTLTTARGNVLQMLLMANPSHLEAVNPVVEGLARARQDRLGEDGKKRVLPVLIHGDAAFSGQGIVAETLNLSQLEGYATGGTIHVVINNQIGFTTLPKDARSTRYSTDIAKMLMVPIFHVHGEAPEACVHVMRLAADYRAEFGRDVVIDVVCYRRYGHNEGDEPYYTQPQMVDRIKDRPPAWELYAQELVKHDGIVSQSHVDRIKEDIQHCLELGYQKAHDGTCVLEKPRFYETWDGMNKAPQGHTTDLASTGLPGEKLLALARKLSIFPGGFSVHRKLERILARRLETVEKGEGIDWATAEMLAFASLLTEGIPVRLSGEDSRRGTFSQRHSVLLDPVSGEQHTPLNALGEEQAPFHVYDSMLSEYAVLGFEYGYSLVDPHVLVIWEAQFGDFANNAQVIIDQFLTSGEIKWRRPSGLVLLLPHGLEGQGSEHSSARLERFLQLCAQDNLQVCYPTTPAQYFHLLRRQIKRDTRNPLVVMAPKSLLRHPQAVSSLREMELGGFREVLGDPAPPVSPRRVIVCSGKVYYDLVERRRSLENSDVAMVRLEQFYPFAGERVGEVLSKYGEVQEWVWVQEEPENMGGWSFVRHRLESLTGKPFSYIGRPASATPAAGYLSVYKEEQAALLDKALGRVGQSG